MIMRKIVLILGLLVLSMGATSLAQGYKEKGLDISSQDDYIPTFWEWLIASYQVVANPQVNLVHMKYNG